MASKEAYLKQAFTELAKADTSGDYERALRTANRILKQYPHEATAFKCKVVSLIHLNKFEETLTLLRKTPPLLTRETHFEKAYCEYRLYKTSDAVETLLSACQNDVSTLHPNSQELLAQLYYRLDKFEDCQKLYVKLLKATSDDFDSERQTNLMAAHAQLTVAKPDTDKLKLSISSFEQHYNQACFLVAKQDFAGAIKHLKKSLDECRAVLTEDGVPDDEVEDEQAIMLTQLAYCQQRLGQQQQALDAYNKILGTKPSDASVVAVASNNLVSIRQHHNLFDARKKLKSCASTEQRLSKQQNAIVASNNALLQLPQQSADRLQLDACKRAIQELREKHSCETEAVVLEAALLLRQKDTAKASTLLTNYINQQNMLSDSDVQRLKLLLAQIQLQDGEYAGCVASVQSVRAVPEPSLLSLLVALLLANDPTGQQALALLRDAADKIKDNAGWLSTVYEQTALLHLRLGQKQDTKGQKQMATAWLEKLRQLKPDDPRVVSRLMRIYSDVDAAKAEQLAATLPALMDKVGASSDQQLLPGSSLDSLESSDSILYSKSKKLAKDPASPKGTSEELQRKRRNRKRKPRLPKEYDPKIPPDPERWLPRQERSTYKRKKDKRAKDREIGRGPQGAVSAAASDKLDQSQKPAESPGSPKPSPATATTAPAGAGPRQQRPGAKQTKAKAKANKRKF